MLIDNIFIFKSYNDLQDMDGFISMSIGMHKYYKHPRWHRNFENEVRDYEHFLK